MNDKLVTMSTLWINSTENDEQYLKGYLGAQELVIFDNKRKENEKHPDKKAYLKTKAGEYVEIFSLWKRKTKKGDDFFTGSINKETDLICFLSKNKKTEKSPDMRIYAKQKQRDVVQVENMKNENVDTEEIPF